MITEKRKTQLQSYLKAETHYATNRCDTSRRQVASPALLLRQNTCTVQANLKEGKCELVSKFNMADQRIQRRSNKRKLLVLLMMLLISGSLFGTFDRFALAKWILEFLGIPRNKGVNFHGKFGLGIPRNSQP